MWYESVILVKYRASLIVEDNAVNGGKSWKSRTTKSRLFKSFRQPKLTAAFDFAALFFWTLTISVVN